MRHRAIISGTKSVPIILSKVVCNVRVPVLVAILNVWGAVVLEILPRAFDSVMEALALRLAKLGRWGIPIVIVVVILYGGDQAAAAAVALVGARQASENANRESTIHLSFIA